MFAQTYTRIVSGLTAEKAEQLVKNLPNLNCLESKVEAVTKKQQVPTFHLNEIGKGLLEIWRGTDNSITERDVYLAGNFNGKQLFGKYEITNQDVTTYTVTLRLSDTSDLTSERQALNKYLMAKGFEPATSYSSIAIF